MLLAVAKLEIDSKWKGPRTPNITEWHKKLWNHFIMITVQTLKVNNSVTSLSKFSKTQLPIQSTSLKICNATFHVNFRNLMYTYRILFMLKCILRIVFAFM